jgi:hypothetical protein
MNLEQRENKGPGINEAMNELAGIEANLYPTGAVDSEPAALNEIRAKLMKGETSPSDAIQQARRLVAERQDYH